MHSAIVVFPGSNCVAEMERFLDSYFKQKYSDRLPKSKCEEKSAEILQYILDRRIIKQISTLKRL